MQLVTIVALTNSSGDFTTTISGAAGWLLQYRYLPDGTAPLATGADIDLVGSTSGFVYVNQDNIGTSAFQKLPRHATHDETGTASLYAGSGEPVEDAMAVGGESLTFSVAQGGDTRRGTFYFWFA
jgi:hypothetical protein